MPSQFADTLRSLNADRFHAALIGMGVAIVVVLAWGSWFLLARVATYELSTEAAVDKYGYVVAEFELDKLERIRPGQTAWLYRLQGGIPLPGRSAATVIDIIRSSTDVPRVRLFPNPGEDATKPLLMGQAMRVHVEVASVSPATLVLITSGLNADTAPSGPHPNPGR